VQQEEMDLACQLSARETARQQKILIHPILVTKTFVCLSGFQKIVTHLSPRVFKLHI
jgi:hypothetical protein